MVGSHNSGVVYDSYENIKKCLNCELDECVNCLTYANQRDRTYEKALARKRGDRSVVIVPHPGGRPVVVDDLDREILSGYVEIGNMTAVATHLKLTTNLVVYRIRRKFRLPAPKGLSKEERKALVDGCWKSQ